MIEFHAETQLLRLSVLSSLNHIRIQHMILFEIMRDGVLRQKRCLQPDLGADPFAPSVRRVERVIAASAAAELGTKIGALNLVKLS